MSEAEQLRNWLPYKIAVSDELVFCRWLYLEDKSFSEPFFDETISKCKSFGFNSRHFIPVSNLNILAEWSKSIVSVKPTAFIFHVSRCGSTLLTQLLGINEQHIVLSEVPFFDDLLRLPYKFPNFQKVPEQGLLKEVIQFYGQKRTGNETSLFIKTDSWHVFFWKEIRKLYPEVPFILLYRSPDQVIRSHQKLRGMQAVPGVIEPEIFGFDRDEINGIGLDEYMVKVLERYFALFLEIAENDQTSLLLNYNQGPMQLIQATAAFTNTTINAADKAEMEQRSRYHAKFPGNVFLEEPTDKWIPDYLQKAISLYNQLERKRLEYLSGKS